MAAAGEPEPRSLIMMGGPIDTRRNPTQVNRFATSKPLRWFETNLIHEVPPNYPGRGRRVYPGFLQHAGFIAMNPVRHMSLALGLLPATWSTATTSDADEHRRFYDEYNAVLDMPAEYYLDCVRIVFQQHLLPRGLWHVARRARGARGDHRHGAADHRGRAGRHLGRRARRARRTICAPASRPSGSAT